MSSIFLSQSTKTVPSYGAMETDGFWMSLLADKMEELLNHKKIRFTRTDRKESGTAFELSNQSSCDYRLTLQTNKAPIGLEGYYNGVEVQYGSEKPGVLGLAEALKSHLKEVYPQPSMVWVRPQPLLGERGKQPSVRVKLGYHDNYGDVNWFRENTDEIAQTLVDGVCEFFEI